MKDFFDQFLDFITGGFFNHLGALVRLAFSEKKYPELLKENLSNSIGMVVMTILLFGLFAWIRYQI